MESHGDQTLTYADLAKSLNCPICQDILKSFDIQSCDHTYCLECVEKLAAINGLTSNIRCCPCQNKTSIHSTGLNDPNQNYKLKCLLEEQAANTKQIEALFAEQATKTLTIWVRDRQGKTVTFNVRLSDTADALRRQTEKKFGIPIHLQYMTWAGKQLKGSKTLEEYGMLNESTIKVERILLGSW
ncbi:uncharacterized protein LOC100888317 [Strongylocentrotus purpuratus]|uniref:Uncharacterized protein n=1 Tax=Strongylocentrotus purpuratus TaxID=7668 RepID=A0A7M7HCX1_STRPU|nr:uncharacterized protein LOC100888317 [Strongylocentrotus purpuratus]|eukprot:XP_011663460.1 PREDICTED: uncharacterized protein LOC100888317 [Strongylocentrotus purpuratus]